MKRWSSKYQMWSDDVKKMERVCKDKTVFSKYKIVCPTRKDAEQLMLAFEYLYGVEGISMKFITVCQLLNEYSHPDKSDEETNIVVSKEMYNLLKRKEKHE